LLQVNKVLVNRKNAADVNSYETRTRR